MKVIHGVVFVAASMLLAASAEAGSPHHGQPAHRSAPAHATTPANHPVHVKLMDPATKERLHAVRTEYREKRAKLEAQLKTEQANVKNLERARPRDASAVNEAHSQVKSTLGELRATWKQEQSEITKVLTGTRHGKAHANSVAAKSAEPASKPHTTTTPAP